MCVPQPQCSDAITSLHAFVERLSQGVRVSALRKVTDCSPNGHDAITSSQNPSNVILSQVGKERPMKLYKKMKKTHGCFSENSCFFICAFNKKYTVSAPSKMDHDHMGALRRPSKLHGATERRNPSQSMFLKSTANPKLDTEEHDV